MSDIADVTSTLSRQYDKLLKENEELKGLVQRLIAYEPYSRYNSYSQDESRDKLIKEIKGKLEG